MTVIFESHKLNDKVLIAQFQFESHGVLVNGSDVTGMSMDKYLSLDIWSQIYIKLVEPLERYKLNTTKQLKSETISLRRAQLEMHVSWTKTRSYHSDIVKVAMNKSKDKDKICDICPYVMVINIKTVSVLDKYRKQHSQEIITEKTKDSMSKTSTPSSSNGTRTSNESDARSSIGNDTEEYVPAAIGSSLNLDNSLKYTPSSVSINNNNNATASSHSPDIFHNSSQEYTPTASKVEDDSEVKQAIIYTPTKIETGKGTENSQKHKTSEGVGKSGLDKKKRNNLNDDLFGKDSDSDPDFSVRTKYDRLAKSTISTNSPSHPKSKQTNLNAFVTCRSTKMPQSTKESSKVNDYNRKRKINDISPVQLSPKNTNNRTELNELIALRKEFEKMEYTQTLDRVINLKNVSGDDIVKTLNKFERALLSVREKFAKIPDYKIDPTVQESNYLMILHRLVTPKQQKSMYDTLREKFFDDGTKHEITTNHENLIWKVVLPEWALQIFMKKFNLGRDDALDELKKQENAEINNLSGLDLDF